MIKKSLFLSLLIHAAIMAAVFSLLESVYQQPKEKLIPIQLLNIQKPQKRQKALPPAPKAPHKPKVQKKPHILHPHKIIKKHPQHIKRKPVIKKTVVKRKPVPKPPTKQKQPILKPHISPSPQAVVKTATKQQISTPKTTASSPVKSVIHTQTLSAGQISKIRHTYYNYIYAIIDAHKKYPIIARKLGQTGTVVVTFTILHDGTILHVKIKESSGFSALDGAAQNILRLLGHFKPIPKSLGENTLQVTIPIAYALD
jgi:periplasmic protein TonB